ncbi:DUF4136 domain-containing protein [Roseivirga sp. BDSF3-8]|uniref:DUF4136 domain-containing protein n=1 Tax=Roseivirga sp. BDSF3-8 TaxID=3241598 RepID=UPI00353223EB
MKRNFLTFLVMVMAIPAMAQDKTMNPADLDVEVRYLENGDFEDYDTYSFITDMGNMNQDSWLAMNGIPSAMIEDALEHEMDASGMANANGQNADVIINYHMFDSEYETQAYMATEDAVFLWMSDSYADKATLNEGTIVMNVVDANTGEVVWEGYALGVVDDNGSLSEQRSQIRMGVAQLTERFLAFRNLGPTVAGENGRPFKSNDY